MSNRVPESTGLHSLDPSGPRGVLSRKSLHWMTREQDLARKLLKNLYKRKHIDAARLGHHPRILLGVLKTGMTSMSYKKKKTKEEEKKHSPSCRCPFGIFRVWIPADNREVNSATTTTKAPQVVPSSGEDPETQQLGVDLQTCANKPSEPSVQHLVHLPVPVYTTTQTPVFKHHASFWLS